MSSVLVVGSANMDLVFRCARIPRAGETLLGGEFSTHPGGKGANQAVAIGRLGGSVSFVGAVGVDGFGGVLRESLSGAGVSVAWLESRADLATGAACIVIDDAGMNSIVVAPGANAGVTPGRVTEALRATGAKVALAQLEIPLEAVEAAAAADRFILNPAPAQPLPVELLATCYLLTPNETETEALTGIDPDSDEACLRAGRELLERGVQNVVITLGARGAYWISATEGRAFPAPTVDVVDTTAAGDAFNGALAMFLAEGRELANAIPLANCVGALSTTRRGAQESMPTLEELRVLAGSLF